MRKAPASSAAFFCLLAFLLTGGASSAYAAMDLGVNTASYLGQGASNRQKNYSSLTAGMDFHGRSDVLASRAFVQGLMSFNDRDYRFLEAPELYLGSNPKHLSWGKRTAMQVTLGRKLETWSHLDQHWGLGGWQPRFRWDYLSPQQVGLMGLQAKAHSGPVQATLLYSPIFVPDRGAPIDFADGRMKSNSPWALNPPSSAIFKGRETEIKYAAEIPDVMDVIQHHSVSGKVRVGETRGLWGSVAMAYKPMNQLPMGYDPVILPKKVPEIEVKIYPRITYHSLYSLDSGWSAPTWDFWTSFLVDIPHDDYAFVTERVNQNVSRMMLLSPTYTYHIGRRSAQSGLVSASYLKRFGEDQSDSGIDANGRYNADGSSAFDSRYPYAEAFLIRFLSPRIRGFILDAKLLLDVSHPGTIASWNLGYRTQKDVNFYVGADVLTSWSKQDPEMGTDFIYRYRANDRVTGGVTYVF